MRTRVAGIYIEKNKILLAIHEKNNKRYYLLPGGGVDNNEKFRDALAREWLEELSVKVDIEDFLFMGESIKPNSQISDDSVEESSLSKTHIIQVVFLISKIKGTLKVNPDHRLVGFEFVSFEDLSELKFYPNCRKQIFSYLKNKSLGSSQLFESYKWQD